MVGLIFIFYVPVILPTWPLQLVLKKTNLSLGKAKKCYLFEHKKIIIVCITMSKVYMYTQG